MGYQESYVRVANEGKFDELVKLIKSLGEDYFAEGGGAIPVEVITLKKPIKGNLFFMCKPEKKYEFEANTQFIYVSGERDGQRSPKRFLGNYAPQDLEIYATECFPSQEIFNDPDFADHHEFEW